MSTLRERGRMAQVDLLSAVTVMHREECNNQPEFHISFTCPSSVVLRPWPSWCHGTSWHDSFAPSAVCGKAFPPFSRDQTEPTDILVQTSSETPRRRKSMRSLYFDLHRTESETRTSQHGLCVSCTWSPVDLRVRLSVHLDAMGGGHQRRIGDGLGGGW